MEDTYLGDGVYASFDGYQVWLDLRAQGFSFPTTPSGHQGIALDETVLKALYEYVERIKASVQSANESEAVPDA